MIVLAGFFKKKKPLPPVPPGNALPAHVGIIMDGNGRWAKKRGLPRPVGHREGAQVFRRITKHCEKRGIRHLTFYAFSTENWSRPQDEVDALMKLLETYLVEALSDFKNENIRTGFLGDRAGLSPKLQELMAEVEASTAHKDGMRLNLAINYGGRGDIVQAVQAIARDVAGGRLAPGAIDEAAISSRLYTAGQPDPDMILRPSGELRTSNFLLWQSAYAEYVFMDILWPDFTADDLDRALEEYASRNRRYGGI